MKKVGRDRESGRQTHTQTGNDRENKSAKSERQTVAERTEKQTEGIESLGHRYGERGRENEREIEIESE